MEAFGTSSQEGPFERLIPRPAAVRKLLAKQCTPLPIIHVLALLGMEWKSRSGIVLDPIDGHLSAVQLPGKSI